MLNAEKKHIFYTIILNIESWKNSAYEKVYIPHLIMINFSVSSDDDSFLNAGLRDSSFHCLQQAHETNFKKKATRRNKILHYLERFCMRTHFYISI